MTTKILIVDDEPQMEVMIRQKLRRGIRAGELELLTADDGVEALELLDAQPDIAIALCDINMPRMDGLELLEQMRLRHPLVKSVVISAYGDMDNIRAAMQRGSFDFLLKPVDLQDLQVTIARAIEEALSAREMVRSLRHNNILKQYVNGAVLRFLSGAAAVAELQESEMIEASVAFFDVCGFTHVSEQLEPARVAKLLNTVFDPIVSAVVAHDGQIDKFIGDAVMAIFMGNAHQRRAALAAHSALLALRATDRERMAEFGFAPPVCAGINTGRMVACSVGAHTIGRFDFTVLGDAVNIAARLQDAAAPGQILVSDGIASKLEGLRLTARDGLEFKGKEQRVSAHVLELDARE